MTANGVFQIALYFGLVVLLVKPLGLYMAHVFNGQRTFLDPVLRPVERVIYWLGGGGPPAGAALDDVYGGHAAL